MTLFALVVVIAFYLRKVYQYEKLKHLHEELLIDSTNQLIEYMNFRKLFEDYRARFDPIDTTREGNVITVTRVRKDKDA